MTTSVYTNGLYLANNPTWHVEDSAWKSEQILKMIRCHRLAPQTVCEVGCGAGEVLRQLQCHLPEDCELHGYDISPQAHDLALCRANDRLHFHLGDLEDDPGAEFDLILAIDLIEHLDDCYGFLRRLRPRAEHKIFHIPLDLSAYAVLRSHPILDLRASVGHIHHFTKDTALAALRETGYHVLDWRFPDYRVALRGKPLRQKLLWLLREALCRCSPDFAVRLLGGRSLLVLAR